MCTSYFWTTPKLAEDQEAVVLKQRLKEAEEECRAQTRKNNNEVEKGRTLALGQEQMPSRQ